jgi:FkbM family methyltransferase
MAGANASNPSDPIVIYDVGANNGDDLPYYLKKADRVVAVEANPLLCTQITARFAEAIEQGRLVVENCVLVSDGQACDVPFFIHCTNDVLSQFPRPDDIENFHEVRLPAKTVAALFAGYGPPHFIKIDIEHYDEEILRAIFAAGFRPPFLSAESHSIGVFSALVTLGGYDAFKLVEGSEVSDRCRAHPFVTRSGKTDVCSFPDHSAGPFGDDIHGDWMNASEFFRLLAFAGLGWKDIHATNVRLPKADAKVDPVRWAWRLIYESSPFTADKLGAPVIAARKQVARWRGSYPPAGG